MKETSGYWLVSMHHAKRKDTEEKVLEYFQWVLHQVKNKQLMDFPRSVTKINKI